MTDWERVLREVLAYMAEGGWARGKRDAHELRERTDLKTMAPYPVCKCGHPWPCPVAVAWEAIETLDSATSEGDDDA